MPPTERRGRVHTSTVTVAVLDPDTVVPASYSARSDRDFKVDWFNGTTGAGGQHHQKNATCCRLTHVPTGIVEKREGRARPANLKAAREAIEERLDHAVEVARSGHQSEDRRAQMGTGMRGDKSVTIRFQDDRVTHHVTGRTMSADKYMRGFMDTLWS